MIEVYYFKPHEFFCPHCGKEDMSDDFIDMLSLARDIASVKFRISEGGGWRCREYQESLTKRGFQTAHGVSPHEKGVAADIIITDDSKRFIILSSLIDAGFDRFGIASNFIHVDYDPDRNANRIWHY